MKRTQSLFLFVALFAGAAACGGGEPEAKVPDESATTTDTTQATTPPTGDTAGAGATTPPAGGGDAQKTEAKPATPPTVEDMKASDDPKPMPTVKITAPANDASVGDAAKAKDVEVKLDVKDWPTAEKGPHVHLILDDHPYKAIYDTKKPVKLSELLPAGTDLKEGEHTLVAFASRPTHESVKGRGAQTIQTFWVGKKGKSTFDAKKPHLVYSRPKGENKGGMAKELLIDFYLFGTQLDKGEKVKYSISGPGLTTPLTGEFTKWAPKVVRNLPKGNDYEVTLELVDKDGKGMEGPLTKTTRKGISLDPDAPSDMGPAPTTGGAGATDTAPKK
ncbi:hypothetical protein [Polyangium aurulentum]|uniref:hypothetical protein n=1 Tax=Polyangium aurulentum TaxID=2567896 RepID=UPI0010AE4B11|nr:hypothetical protein [Polyangium aurulentum]UQA62831.1 hypothetical protein E8A73_021215 [Polyangium aurulentum]